MSKVWLEIETKTRKSLETTYLGSSDGQAGDSQKEDDRKQLHFLFRRL
jgi:hypothetical protein